MSVHHWVFAHALPDAVRWALRAACWRMRPRGRLCRALEEAPTGVHVQTNENRCVACGAKLRYTDPAVLSSYGAWGYSFIAVLCDPCAVRHDALACCVWCVGPLAGNRHNGDARRTLCGDCTRHPRDAAEHRRDVYLLTLQIGCSRPQALRALDDADEDLVGAILSLSV
jgi:hypothetical protein